MEADAPRGANSTARRARAARDAVHEPGPRGQKPSHLIRRRKARPGGLSSRKPARAPLTRRQGVAVEPRSSTRPRSTSGSEPHCARLPRRRDPCIRTCSCSPFEREGWCWARVGQCLSGGVAGQQPCEWASTQQTDRPACVFTSTLTLKEPLSSTGLSRIISETSMTASRHAPVSEEASPSRTISGSTPVTR